MGHLGSNQGPFALQPNALPLSYIPAANRFKNIRFNKCTLSLQTRSGCLSTGTKFFVPSQVYSRDRCHFSLSLSKIIQGDTRVRSLGHPGSKTSLQTRASCLSTVTKFFVPSQVYSRDQCHFSLSLSKIIQGDTRVRTRDLSDCSRMLYHWAISPLHTDSITSLQTPAVCLSTVVPSQVYDVILL